MLMQIQAKLESLMDTHQIPGLALGIIKNDSIWYEGFYGKSLRNTPVSKSSVFRTFDVTKLLLNTAVFKLIEEKKIQLVRLKNADDVLDIGEIVF